jgi:hemerythrin-like domain-containing protein
MNLLPLLLGEHGPLRRGLETLRRTAPALGDDALQASVRELAEAIESHAALEDELLFATLAATAGVPAGPVEAMLAEHRQIEALLGQLLAPAGTPAAADRPRTVLRLVELVRNHFDHEEHVLFPIAARTLDADRLADLGREWAQRRGVALDALAGAGTAGAAR